MILERSIDSPHVRASEMIVVPAGSFVMGATAGDKFATDTERPAHRVTFSLPFALGLRPVTNAEYRAFDPEHAAAADDALPVTRLSWHNAAAYCAWLADVTGRRFRLPAESEWEYACRAGSTTPFATGIAIGLEDANFLYSETGERIGVGRLLPPGRFAANAFGFQDLHGNVCEWVADIWHRDYAGAPVDGTAWLEHGDADRRVIRGGAWDHLPRLLRSAWRDALPATATRDNLGFRVAETLSS